MQPPLRMHGAVLTPLDPHRVQWFPDGVVVVGEEGTIRLAGSAAELPLSLSSLPKVEIDGVLIPGFVDCHTHLPQYDCRGMHATSLLEWLERYIYPEEQRYADPAFARKASRRFFSALTRNGTTTAGVFLSSHPTATQIAFEEADASGLRAVMGLTLMDRGAPTSLLLPAETALSASEDLIRRWQGRSSRLHYAVVPRFAPACTDALLASAGRMSARHSLHVHTHINENAAEVALVREIFPGDSSYADVYDRHGLLHSRTLLAHSVHTDEEQLALFRSRGCAVVHCPESNLLLGSGRFPLDAHDDQALRVGLGTDVGAGASLSMFDAMRTMCFAQARPVPPARVFHAATLGGAEALSLDAETGSLTAGKHADIVAVSAAVFTEGGRSLASLTADEALALLVYRARAGDILRCWADGRSVYAS